MKRRELLAGLGSLTALGAGAAVYTTRPSGENGREPIPVETLAAPGSEAGETRIPERGRVTFLDVFATWCTICQGMMPTLREVHDQVEDVQFVSVSNEAVGTVTERDDISEWWREHDGNWTVGVDTDLTLTAELDIRTVPASFVFDEENRLVHTETGRKTTETLVDWIEST